MLNRFTRNNARNGKAREAFDDPDLPLYPDDALALDDALNELSGGNRLLRSDLVEAKVRLHRRLIDELNLAAIDMMSVAELRQQVFKLVSDHVLAERILLNSQELDNFVDEVLDELTGLGPIEPLLKDPTVTDILINTHRHVYVERNGKLELVPVRFKDESHVLRIVNKIVSAVGRRVDESQPMVDARLQDGSRINVAIRPVAVDGPLVSIRKFSEQPFTLGTLIKIGSLPEAIADLLSGAVKAKVSMLVSGGTGAGKTTLLNALSTFIGNSERLITIEDAAELQLQQPHVGRMETRPPNIEGRGEIRQRELVKNALRMRPDRIIVGEVRGEEAFDMLQAMTTGHEGSMATIHANSPRDALIRLEQMVGMAGLNLSERSIRAHISSALRIVIQLERLSDGKRRLTSVCEVTGTEGDVIQMQEIFKFERTGTTVDGTIIGEFRATGIRPTFLEDLQLRGVRSPVNAFSPGRPL